MLINLAKLKVVRAGDRVGGMRAHLRCIVCQLAFQQKSHKHTSYFLRPTSTTPCHFVMLFKCYMLYDGQ